MRHGPIAGQSCRWNKCYSPGPAWSLERSSPNIKSGDRTAIASNSAMAGCTTSQRVNTRIAQTQRQDAYLSLSRSKGNQMASQVAKPPYAPPPREPGFPPPARPPRPDRRSTANRIGLPIRRIREACGWDSAYCCQPMHQLLTTGSPPITNYPLQQVSAA